MSLLPILKIEQWKQAKTIQTQLLSFERMYEKSQQCAVIEGYTSVISADKLNQQISYQYYFKGQEKRDVVSIQKPLEIKKNSEVKLKGGSASPSKLETFSFFDKSTNTTIRYVVQLGSSKVFKYVEKE